MNSTINPTDSGGGKSRACIRCGAFSSHLVPPPQGTDGITNYQTSSSRRIDIRKNIFCFYPFVFRDMLSDLLQDSRRAKGAPAEKDDPAASPEQKEQKTGRSKITKKKRQPNQQEEKGDRPTENTTAARTRRRGFLFLSGIVMLGVLSRIQRLQLNLFAN